MITISQSNLKKMLNKHFPANKYSNSLAETFRVDKEAEFWNITHADAYASPTFNAEALVNFCKELGTFDVHNTEDINNSGCETCDWGSEYGFALSIPVTEIDITGV